MGKIINSIIVVSLCLLPQIAFAQNGKQYFGKDEYGALYYYDATGGWNHNWLFKKKVNFKSVQIVMVDEEGIQKILVQNETINHSPFWVAFRIGRPKLLGSKIAPTLTVPYGFSRIGYKPIGESNWFTVNGNDLLDMSCNGDPTFDGTGSMLLCMIKTTRDEELHQYRILLKYEIE